MLEDAEKNARNRPAPTPNSDDEDESELGLIVSNTLNEMLGQEASLASNSNTSFAVEKLTRHMTAKQLLAFIHNMSGLYGHLFSNRFVNLRKDLFKSLDGMICPKRHLSITVVL